MTDTAKPTSKTSIAMKPFTIATDMGPVEVMGLAVQGTPFVIHQSHASAGGGRGKPWKVTHEKTGYAALSFCRSKASAFTAAKELAALDCDWEFSHPKDAAKIGLKYRDQLIAIRNRAS